MRIPGPDIPDLSVAPSGGPITAILGGIAAPIPLLCYSVNALLQQETYLPSRRGSGITVDGQAAGWLAISYLCLACLVHFHFFGGET
tara:strand:- start:352 stop:612 length:261 start_codon:yes stop_codon:yes gene_type:complete